MKKYFLVEWFGVRNEFESESVYGFNVDDISNLSDCKNWVLDSNEDFIDDEFYYDRMVDVSSSGFEGVRLCLEICFNEDKMCRVREIFNVYVD